jgi:large subunit ribosomal protein L10
LAITRKRKEELVQIYTDLLKVASGVVITEYRGLTVAQVNQLRDRLRESEGHYHVAKNTLFMRALKEAGWPVPEDLLVGPVAIAFGDGNFPTVAKTILGAVKDYEEFLVVKGGVMPAQALNRAQLEMVSNLPSLPELRAQLAGLVSQPAAGIVGALNGGVAAVAQVLEAWVQKNSPEGEAA